MTTYHGSLLFRRRDAACCVLPIDWQPDSWLAGLFRELGLGNWRLAGLRASSSVSHLLLTMESTSILDVWSRPATICETSLTLILLLLDQPSAFPSLLLHRPVWQRSELNAKRRLAFRPKLALDLS